jgi:hypothetical protein
VTSFNYWKRLSKRDYIEFLCYAVSGVSGFGSAVGILFQGLQWRRPRRHLLCPQTASLDLLMMHRPTIINRMNERKVLYPLSSPAGCFVPVHVAMRGGRSVEGWKKFVGLF